MYHEMYFALKEVSDLISLKNQKILEINKNKEILSQNIRALKANKDNDHSIFFYLFKFFG